MIYDNLENLGQYTGLFENLDTCIEYIENNALEELPLGDTAIDGDKVIARVVEADTVPSEDKPYETHTRYMDMHIDLDGLELCEVSLGDGEEVQAYDEAADAALWKNDVSSAMVLGEGRFVLFMVEEAHKALVRAEGCTHVRKVIFKIAYL